jgi:hypothetical protein
MAQSQTNRPTLCGGHVRRELHTSVQYQELQSSQASLITRIPSSHRPSKACLPTLSLAQLSPRALFQYQHPNVRRWKRNLSLAKAYCWRPDSPTNPFFLRVGLELTEQIRFCGTASNLIPGKGMIISFHRQH